MVKIRMGSMTPCSQLLSDDVVNVFKDEVQCVIHSCCISVMQSNGLMWITMILVKSQDREN